MKGRVAALMGFGAGYVLGAKAGRERYEQLQRLYENLIDSPPVQKATGKAKDVAETGFDQARDLASEGASKVTEAVRERRSADEKQSGSLSVAPPPQG